MEGDSPMWFLSKRKPSQSAARSKRSNFRPRLESLEDRCLLSAGALDPTFGMGGIATPAASIAGTAAALAVYPNTGSPTDGDIVAAGYVNISNTQGQPNNDFAVVLYRPNGF